MVKYLRMGSDAEKAHAKEWKKRQQVKAKQAKAKRKFKEATAQAFKAFKTSESFSNAKVTFIISAYVEGMKGCRVRFSTHFLELDLYFLDEDSESEEELPPMGPGADAGATGNVL